MANLYNLYFQIDPKYYAAVTADLIEQGKVSWKGFYPHETFVKLLETTYRVLSGQATRSIWVEGAYGTGKSHAALTVKSLVDATAEEVIDYFDDYGLNTTLRDKFVSLKSENILTIHRIGSAGINTDMDLVLAVQQSIMAALKARGIQNQGDASMKDAFLTWIAKRANRNYFADLVSDEQYAWDFNGVSVEDIVEKLNSGTDKQIETTMNKVMKVLKDAGQYGIFSDVTQMAGWIRSVIKENNLDAILFVWDEFSEYFLTHPVGLTGFQTLAEISQSDPFYFMIVAHESQNLFADKDTANKTLDRFEKSIKVELPENMAFQLMAQAMKTTDDAVLMPKWEMYKNSLNDQLTGVRNTIASITKKQNKFGQKTVLSDMELQGIVPIHPYAALVLKNIAVLFNSNQRSMFDFIISEDMTDAKGFKWYINNYGPLDDEMYLLTVDLLWDFFYGKGQTGLNDDVRGILDNYTMLQSDKLLPEEQRVMKTILLLQAVSLRVTGNELLVPDDQNIDLSFQGTDWNKGKAVAIANGLERKGLLFKKPVAGGKLEYCVASAGPSVDIGPIRKKVIDETKTQGLITAAKLGEAITYPNAIKGRYITAETGYGAFTSTVNAMRNKTVSERIKVIFTFAMDDKEAAQIQQQIIKQINMPNNDIVFVETLSPMGKDLYDQYIESMTFSKYNVGKDGDQARHYEGQAINVLASWKSKIASGAFNIYTPDHKSAERKANASDLQDAFVTMNHKIYHYGLEQYNLNATMYTMYQVANGAGYGIEQKLSRAYDNKNNPKMSFEKALEGAWGVPNYWDDSSKQSLIIVRWKKKIDELIQNGFESVSARVSVLSIVEEMEKAPYGLMPSSLAALVLGFILKEYATSDYFWSNGSNSETMSVEHLKSAIANALNQKVNPSPKYKEEYIVAMSAEIRSFLKCTQAAFHISSVGSVESARDQIRIKMKSLAFPVWCVKYALGDIALKSSREIIEQIIDDYCGIANTANSGMASESELAERIGRAVLREPGIKDDLEKVLTDEQCRRGMLEFINEYRDGLLPKLAAEINDGGTYLDVVKTRFSAGDANWVWNISTAEEKISDVILEYQIVAESSKSLGRYSTLKSIESAWNAKTNQIKMSCEVLTKVTGDLKYFLKQLCSLTQVGKISDLQRFYDLLLLQRESFEAFYKNQVPYFEQEAASFLGELTHDEIVELYSSLPAGQFTKSQSEYYKFIQAEIDKFVQGQWKKKIRDLWYENTHTITPYAWSERFETPILCMFDDEERATAKEMFRIINSSSSPSEAEAKKAIEWMKNADFYDRLESDAERDRCFNKRIIGGNAILLKDVRKVRAALIATVHDRIYDWMDNSSIQNQLKRLVDKEYKLTGCDEALAVIDKMDADQLRKYLRERIMVDSVFGIQILKGE